MSNSEAKTNENNHEQQITDRQKQSSFQLSTLQQSQHSISPLTVHHPSTTIIPQQETTQVTMRCDAPPFLPSTTTVNESTVYHDRTSFIYDLKKYKYDYFLSNLSGSNDRDYAKFSSPTGISALNDDRLLVANFDRDSLLIVDIKGVVYQIYKDLPTPKDVLYYSSNPSQAVIATKKEVVILDLSTQQIVVRSKIRGFYPWNIQYIKEREAFAACDPSGERIVYLDKNLAEIGSWSFKDETQFGLQGSAYKKVYPYAAYFLPDDTSFALAHFDNKCQLKEFDIGNNECKRIVNTPPSLLSYSIYVDGARKCLIADKVNRQLISVDKDSNIEEYKCKSIQEPYSMTFLSTGTLCVTDWNKSHGTYGGVAIISENDLKNI